MPILTATELGHTFGAEELFTGLTLKVDARDRIGLVGPNGVGKTTLLLILSGLLEPSAGQVARAEGLTVGYLRQEAVLTFRGQAHTVWEEMLTVYADLRALEQQLRDLETILGQEEATDEILDEYGRLQQLYDAGGGYGYQVDIRRVLQGLGFPPEEWETPLAHLSGGQKTRALLARLLLEKPDLLILDEPTNHLDMPAVEWLERTLRTWVGALIIVSHDRYFLDAVINQMWELTYQGLQGYRGNYSNFVQQRHEAWQRRQALFAAEKERLESELDFVRRHIAGGKTDIAKGKLKRLTRDIILIEEVGVTGREGKSWLEIGGRVRTFSANEAARRLSALKLPDDGPPPLAMRLQPEQHSARSVLRGRRVQIGYPQRPLFVTEPFQLDRRDCAALLGPNGSGKSTFLRTVLGELEPLQGTLKPGEKVQIGYFAQAHEQLDSRNRVLDELLAHKPMSPEDGRNYLAHYLFRGDDVFKRVGELSGGERGRLALALLAADGANFLLLDEPTNHLDIPSQEVLQVVLEQYDGTILLVSHDRYLVNRLANQIWEIEEGQMRVFRGGYEAYRRFRDQEAQEEVAAERGAAAGREPLEWVENLKPPPLGKKAQREQQHRRYALQGAIEDLEFQLQLQRAQQRQSAAAGDEGSQAAAAEAIQRLEAELQELNEELEALVT